MSEHHGLLPPLPDQHLLCVTVRASAPDEPEVATYPILGWSVIRPVDDPDPPVIEAFPVVGPIGVDVRDWPPSVDDDRRPRPFPDDSEQVMPHHVQILRRFAYSEGKGRYFRSLCGTERYFSRGSFEDVCKEEFASWQKTAAENLRDLHDSEEEETT